jgi:hypothetical protein
MRTAAKVAAWTIENPTRSTPMLSRTSYLSVITLATAVAAMASASMAQAGMGHANFAGSKSVTNQPAPTPLRMQARPQMIDTKVKLMHCYHTRERNELGVYIHRTHCG